MVYIYMVFTIEISLVFTNEISVFVTGSRRYSKDKGLGLAKTHFFKPRRGKHECRTHSDTVCQLAKCFYI